MSMSKTDSEMEAGRAQAAARRRRGALRPVKTVWDEPVIERALAGLQLIFAEFGYPTLMDETAAPSTGTAV